MINREARVTKIFWTTAAANGKLTVRVQRMKGVTGDIGHSVEAPNLAIWSYGRLHSREHADNLKPPRLSWGFFIPSFPALNPPPPPASRRVHLGSSSSANLARDKSGCGRLRRYRRYKKGNRHETEGVYPFQPM